MSLTYFLRRLGIFILVVLIASTLNFFLPRLTGQNPVREKLYQEAERGGYLQDNFEEIVAVFEERYGLNDPLIVQYGKYMWGVLQLDFGRSIVNFPKSVASSLVERLPWTLALGGTATLLSFFLGSFLGALIGWERSPGFVKYLFTPLLTMSAVPYYMLGLVLLYLFSFRLSWFPQFGGYPIATIPDWSDLGFLWDVLRHAALPALSIMLANAGASALTMRGMMITTQGEDYMLMAEAKGLPGRFIFRQYAVRNALLPQTTILALALGTIITNIVLVEIVFSYPGVGGLLLQAINESDFPTLQGVVLAVIIAIAAFTFILDLIYPLIDPRINYGKR